MILNLTTSTIEILLGGAITTNQLKVTASWAEMDDATPAFTPHGAGYSTNSGTAVTIIPAPSSTSAPIKVGEISVENLDTVTANVTIRRNDNGTTYGWMNSIPLDPGDRMEYQDPSGWKVMRADGSFKTGIIGPTGHTPVLYSGTAAPSTLHTDGDLYLRTTTGDLYSQIAGAWVSAGNITGPAGPANLTSASTALVISAGVVNIDLSLGYLFTLALTANVTSITFSNLPGSGKGQDILVRMQQDATGSRTVALPASFKALSGSDTVVQSAANAPTVIALATLDNGSRWEYAMKAGAP